MQADSRLSHLEGHSDPTRPPEASGVRAGSGLSAEGFGTSAAGLRSTQPQAGPAEGSLTQPTPTAGPFLSGIILAAGASTRMGWPKQLLSLGGQPLLQRVLTEAATSCLDEVILVLGYRAEDIRKAIKCSAPVRVVMNPDFAEGQSASLRAGLRAASPRAAAAAILLGDQPGVTKALIDQMAAAFLAGGLPAARPVYAGPNGRRIPGHPVFLARRTWPDLEDLRGDEGARALLRAHPEWLLEVAVAGNPPRDIDTWEEYQQAVDEV